jgi:hypothetical protein
MNLILLAVTTIRAPPCRGTPGKQCMSDIFNELSDSEGRTFNVSTAAAKIFFETEFACTSMDPNKLVLPGPHDKRTLDLRPDALTPATIRFTDSLCSCHYPPNSTWITSWTCKSLMGFRQSQTIALILFYRRHHPKSMVLDLSGSSTPWKILPSDNFLQVEFIVPEFIQMLTTCTAQT